MSCPPHLRSTIHHTVAYITCLHRLVDHLTRLRISGRSEGTRNRPFGRVRPQQGQSATLRQLILARIPDETEPPRRVSSLNPLHQWSHGPDRPVTQGKGTTS